MLSIALYQPEIAPNTGNIIRLCANTGAALHLIEPLGFAMDDKRLRRAGLDYHEFAPVHRHPSLAALLEAVGPKRVLACTTRASRCYADVAFARDDLLLFGPETRGLPGDVLARTGRARWVKIPMQSDSRSLNLANAVAVVVFEALRQHNFPGLEA